VGKIYVDAGLFAVADQIAEDHLPPRLLRWRRRLVDKLRLRTAIYNALVSARRSALEEHNGK
jgi:hypothetical protein